MNDGPLRIDLAQLNRGALMQAGIVDCGRIVESRVLDDVVIIEVVSLSEHAAHGSTTYS